MTESEKWMIALTAVSVLIALVGVIVAVVVANKKQPIEVSPQPLAVQIVKELHEQFADKEVFEKHVLGNTARHAQLFQRIDEVERTTRKELADAISGINTDRAHTMEKLNETFTFIRESISELRTDIKHLSNE